LQFLDERRRLSIILDYVFGNGVSKALPKEGLKLVYSRKSGRVKFIFYRDELFATMKPSGDVALTVYGATLLLRGKAFLKNCVVVQDDAAKFVSQGKSAFCRFVKSAGVNVLPRSEVAVLDSKGRVVGVGRAIMAGRFMREFSHGVAVKTRQGASTPLGSREKVKQGLTTE
jgi:uncharacterized protein with predicted RNA binding PUA domain